METNDITVLVLREIRDEIKGVRSEQELMRREQELMRQEQQLMRQEQQQTNARLDTLETTVTREIVEFRKEFVVVRDLLIGRRDLGQRVARVEADVADLKRRVP